MKTSPSSKLFGKIVHLLLDTKYRLSQLNFKDLSNRLRLCSFKPPWRISPSSISFLHFGGFPHQRNFEKVSFRSLIQDELGLGRDSNICVILEINRDLIIVTFP